MLLISNLHFDALTAFGLLAVSLILLFYAPENRSRHCPLLFAGDWVMGSTYGFMQGAGPFGLVEAIWSLVTIRKWRAIRVSQGAWDVHRHFQTSVYAVLEEPPLRTNDSVSEYPAKTHA